MSVVGDRARRPLLNLFPPLRLVQRQHDLHADSQPDTVTYETFYGLSRTGVQPLHRSKVRLSQ